MIAVITTAAGNAAHSLHLQLNKHRSGISSQLINVTCKLPWGHLMDSLSAFPECKVVRMSPAKRRRPPLNAGKTPEMVLNFCDSSAFDWQQARLSTAGAPRPMPMIQFANNNGDMHAAFISVALLAPSSKYKWPSFRCCFLSCRPPDEEVQKEKTEMFACRGVLRARGPLLASSGATALIAGSLASPEPPSPPRHGGPGSHRAPTEDAIVPSTCCTLSGKPRAPPPAHCDRARSLSSKRD